jgi:hypothetical protein
MAEKEFVTMVPPKDNDESKPLRIRRGRVESVDLYEIKDSELDLLEKGSPADLQLNFAIFLLSAAISAICTLATATFSNTTVQTVFIVVTVVGLLLGIYLLIAWWRNRTSLKSVADRIRQRIPPDVAATEEKPEDQLDEKEHGEPTG